MTPTLEVSGKKLLPPVIKTLSEGSLWPEFTSNAVPSRFTLGKLFLFYFFIDFSPIQIVSIWRQKEWHFNYRFLQNHYNIV